MSNNVNLFVTGSEVISGSMVSTGSVILTELTASYIAGSDVDGAVESANTGSYVAAANVDGTVATATSASHALKADDADSVDYTNVQNKPALVSESMDATLGDISVGVLSGSDAWFSGDVTALGTGSFTVLKTLFVTESIIEASGSTKFGDSADDVHQRTGSLEVTLGGFTGSFQGDGSEITGVVSASHAQKADDADTSTSASHALQADSSSYVQGANVDGPVDELSGSIRLEKKSAMSGSQFVHERYDLGILSSNFTMSFAQGNVQRFQAGDNLSFDISGLEPGGIYVAEVENTGSFEINLPNGLLWHEGTAYPSASIGIDALDVYGFYRAGSQTVAYVMARSASVGV